MTPIEKAAIEYIALRRTYGIGEHDWLTVVRARERLEAAIDSGAVTPITAAAGDYVDAARAFDAAPTRACEEERRAADAARERLQAAIERMAPVERAAIEYVIAWHAYDDEPGYDVFRALEAARLRLKAAVDAERAR